MSKAIPLHLILSALKRKPLYEQIALLRGLIKSELPYSVRRNELASLLQGKLTKQLRRENRAA